MGDQVKRLGWGSFCKKKDKEERERESERDREREREKGRSIKFFVGAMLRWGK